MGCRCCYISALANDGEDVTAAEQSQLLLPVDLAAVARHTISMLSDKKDDRWDSGIGLLNASNLRAHFFSNVLNI